MTYSQVSEAEALFQKGRVVRRMFGVIEVNALNFSVLGVLVAIPITAADLVSHSFTAGLARVGFGYRTVVVAGLAAFLLMFGQYFLQAAPVHATIVSLTGKRASILDCLSTGLANFFALVLIAMLQGLGVLAGLVLFVIPGLVLAVKWSMAVPVRVVERTGIIASLRRSSQLTRDCGWPVFQLIIALGVFQFAVSWLFGDFSGQRVRPALVGQSLLDILMANATPLAVLGALLNQTISSVVSAACFASIYYELRTVKEGVGPEALAAVFD